MQETSLTRQDEKALKALIDWWAEAGLELDAPIVRAKPGRAPAPAAKPRAIAKPPRAATAAAARAAGFGDTRKAGPGALEAAAKADTLEALEKVIGEFEGCALKRTARNTVFARGNAGARIMIVGEAPGRDEDEQGKPFVGRSGQLLDRMFAAIGLGEDDLYISNIVNWRPPGNRNPTQEEIAICLPLIERHIALKAPDFLVVAGGVSAQSLLRSETGITRLRGQWSDYKLRDASGAETGQTIPCLPVFHPSFLLRQPASKRQAWSDMLALEARLNGR
ncbi:uracil-DNA glycosylase [Maricaulis sp.]|uniref:uracil-DNA glycosylase n=1 Tax=Maricaulis sp. TaxID=1486257 RepID=UPI00260C29C9|nr:uracil-DNA glycosylase [Maricaulis sp.]